MGTKENATMPDRNSAYTAIWQGVKSGKLKRRKCSVCGAGNTQAHHLAGYSGTKGIVWLCDKHHRSRHSKKQSVSKSIEIVKTDDERHIVHLIMAKPNELDTDKQWFESEDIELMAHRYAVRYFLGDAAIYEEHKQKLTNVYLIETYLAPVDFTLTDHKGRERVVRRGSWVVGLWMPNDSDWAKVKSGEYAGGSVRGPARLTPGEVPNDSSIDGKLDVPVVG